jgi:hypothetical protein
VTVYISTPPTVVASYIQDELLLDEAYEICDTLVTLSVESFSTVTGEISYLWSDENDLIDEDDLTKEMPSFSTVGEDPGTYSFGLSVFDGLLWSEESLVPPITIGENLCPHAIAHVAVPNEEDWRNIPSSLLYFDYEDFDDIGNGVWDVDEFWYDIGNYVYDDGEDFTDLNGNGTWDEGEWWQDLQGGVDLNGNGVIDNEDTFEGYVLHYQ